MTDRSYDKDQVKEIGPDRACAEWLIRNGGKVVFEEGEKTSDYNKLATLGSDVRKRLVEIDATDSPITHHGFQHLQGCLYLRKIILHNTPNIDDEALKKLSFAEPSLRTLQISHCGNVTDKGITSLAILKNLTKLVLFNLPEVKKWDHCEQILKKELLKCDISIGRPL